MLKYHIINLASCRLCPRRAAGGKERRYMDQNDKNKSNKNNDRRRGVLSLLIWALVLTIGFNYLLSAMDTKKLAESTCEIRYDEFLDLVRDGKVKEVEIADRTLNITPVDGFTYTDADGKTYSGDFQLFTTQINDPELRSFLDENGVEFGKPYKAETSYLEIIMLNYVLPTALMVGAFILMMRFISKKTGGGGFGGLGSVGKSNAKVYMENPPASPLPTSPVRTRRRNPSSRSSTSCTIPRSIPTSARSCRAVRCSSALRARAKRCSPRRSRVKRTCHSSPSPAPALWRCSWASARAACATSLPRPRR